MQAVNLKVSIITPVYNGAQYLDFLIESVYQQMYQPVEHIIIDDGSQDNGATVEILKNYDHLRWWTRENRGQYATMNEGLLAATGDVVCFISADDLVLPGAIQNAINCLALCNEFVAVYGNYKFINSAGQELKYIHPMRIMPTRLYPYSLHIAHSSLYLRRDFLMKNSLFFDDKLRYVGDYDWIVRIIRSNARIVKLKSDFAAIRLHGNQTSQLGFYAMKKEILITQKKLGVSIVIAWFFRKVMFIAELINITVEKGILRMLETFISRAKQTISNI